MRNLLKITVIVLIVLVAGSTKAQTQKFGHIDFQGLIQLMPERDSAEKAFNKFQTELEDLLATMQKEYQAMVDEFQKLPANTSEIVKNAKIQDIQDKNTRIQNYQTTANQQLQAKYSELLKPVVDKAKNAVEAVGKEQGLLYVFDVNEQSGIVLYRSNESKDILPLVKAKLGIK